MAYEKELCDLCGKNPARHRMMKAPTSEQICCRCYVSDGHLPFDTHSDCIAAAAEFNADYLEG